MNSILTKWQDKIDHYKQIKQIGLDRLENDYLSSSNQARLKEKLNGLDSRIRLCKEVIEDLKTLKQMT